MRWSAATLGAALAILAAPVGALARPGGPRAQGDTDGSAEPKTYTLQLISGTFHGPGALPDAECPHGYLGHIEFRKPLTGESRFFNNGAAEPNVPDEIDGQIDGRLSDGRPFNEHVFGGIAEVGGGALRLMTVILGTGPNQGRELYELDDAYHLNLTVDLAMDPGFPEGIIVRENLHITTGLLWVPLSLQTASGLPGGQDRAGSLPAGVPVVGRLGDYDRDGFIDGTIAGGANVPLGHMLSPGSPVVLERRFTSDIPVSAWDAAFLTIASVSSYAPVWKRFLETRGQAEPAARHLETHLAEYARSLAEAWESAGALLDLASRDKRAAVPAGVRDAVRAQMASSAAVREWSRNGVAAAPIPDRITEQVQAGFVAANRIVAAMAPSTVFRRQ